jgi:hypothetical protein
MTILSPPLSATCDMARAYEVPIWSLGLGAVHDDRRVCPVDPQGDGFAWPRRGLVEPQIRTQGLAATAQSCVTP